MEDPWVPVPDPFGALEPPRRNPPTAVGVATPPPPHGPGPGYVDRRITRRRRLASAFTGTLLTASGAPLTIGSSAWLTILGAGLSAIGALLIYRAMRPARSRRAKPVLRLGTFRGRFSLKRRRAA